MVNRDDQDAAPIRSVVHPTDLTAGSELAFAHALKIAVAAKAKLYLLHAQREHAELDWAAFPAVRQTLSGWGLLKDKVSLGAVDEGLDIRPRKVRLQDRNAVRAVLKFLADHPSDLIVLATHGRDGLSRWLRGSVAEPLARQADTPALLIPHGARGFVARESGRLQLKRILVPVNHRPRPDAALHATWRLGRLLGAADLSLRLLYVGDADEMPAVRLPAALAERIERTVCKGDVVDAILQTAADFEADLIAMATAGHQGFIDAIRGSTTERVLRQAGCPVLAVPCR